MLQFRPLQIKQPVAPHLLLQHNKLWGGTRITHQRVSVTVRRKTAGGPESPDIGAVSQRRNVPMRSQAGNQTGELKTPYVINFIMLFHTHGVFLCTDWPSTLIIILKSPWLQRKLFYLTTLTAPKHYFMVSAVTLAVSLPGTNGRTLMGHTFILLDLPTDEIHLKIINLAW